MGRSKYGNKKCSFMGMAFDSVHEMMRYQELVLMERAGEIKDLRTQVKFILIPTQREKSTEFYKSGEKKGQAKPGKLIEKECSYIADFVYWDKKLQKTVVEDAKGLRTEAYKIKRKLLLKEYNLRIVEV